MSKESLRKSFLRLAAGLTISGDDALEALNLYQNAEMKYWASFALAYLDIGAIKKAKILLEQLLETGDDELEILHELENAVREMVSEVPEWYRMTGQDDSCTLALKLAKLDKLRE